MGHDDAIRYRLPTSVIEFSGTVTRTHDSLLRRDDHDAVAKAVLASYGEEAQQTAKIDSGWLRDTAVALELTEDGRLISSAVESSGQLGKVVLAAASTGGLLAGLALGLPPGVLIAAAGAVAGRVHLDFVDEETKRRLEQSTALTDDEAKIAEAYDKLYPHLRPLSGRYAGVVLELKLKQQAATAEIAEADNAADRASALWKLRTLSHALKSAEVELDRLREHFKTWRATTITTTSEEREVLVPLDSLRKSGVTLQGSKPHFPGNLNEHSRKLKDVWDTLGLYVELPDVDPKAPPATIEAAGDNEILYREPRQERINIYKKDEEGKVVLIESKQHLVMDELSVVRKIKLHKSLWAKRASTLKFSADGALTGYASTAAAAGAAFAETVQGVPASIAASLEQSKKIYDQVDGLRNRTLDQKLARIKKEVELKQQEILKDDLLATSSQHAELERLKQQAAILEQSKLIAGYGPPSADAVELATLTKKVELLSAKYELAVVERAIASEAALGDVWSRLEQLEAQKALAGATGNGGAGGST